MAKYQSMLVVIDPNRDDQPALRRAVYLHQRIGGRIKAFCRSMIFPYEMTTCCRRMNGRQCVRASLPNERPGSREQAKFYLESGVPIDVKVVWHNRPSKRLFRRWSVRNTICC